MKLLLRRRWLSIGGLTAAITLCAGPVTGAGYSSGFEGLDGSADGVLLTGQDGYYLPPDTDSADWMVYTYADNALGLPLNPYGGAQFVGAYGPADSVYARAQRDVDYGDGSLFTITYDFAGKFMGQGETGQYLGSFSTQPYPGAATFINLMNWVDELIPTNYNSWYMAYDAGGTAFAAPGLSPGAAWDGLDVDHWYRSYTTFDYEANMITEVGIMDLTTGAASVFSPSDWYLEGGAGGGFGMPTGFRFFAGAATIPGNSMGFDNIDIIPAPGSFALLGFGALVGLRRRRK